MALDHDPVYVALFDYDEKRANADLSFRKGEKFRVIINDQDCDWWPAQSLDSGQKGYIPSTYVTEYIHDHQHEDWYFGAINRAEATRLLQPSLRGSFLIRDSESTPGDYSLGIQDGEKIRFYRIRQLEGGAFFVTRRVSFETLKDLVEYYKMQADGLCCSLNSACTKKEPQISLSYKMQLMLEIPRESITLVDEGHSGQFGELYKGFWNKTVPVAVTVVETGIILPLALIEEADILKKLNHPKLVKLYGVCIKDGPMYIITEFMPKGSLLDYLQSSEGRNLELPQLMTDMAAQIAAGMAYLEMNEYVHCSLAARSVLVSDDNECKVADYGLFKLIKDDRRKFPIKWTAPEVVQSKRFSIKSDVWSFGILLYELVTYGKEPYPDMTDSEVLAQVEKGYRMPAAPLDTPEHLYGIMLDCWKTNPVDRPTFETLQWRMEEYDTFAS